MHYRRVTIFYNNAMSTRASLFQLPGRRDQHMLGRHAVATGRTARCSMGCQRLCCVLDLTSSMGRGLRGLRPELLFRQSFFGETVARSLRRRDVVGGMAGHHSMCGAEGVAATQGRTVSAANSHGVRRPTCASDRTCRVRAECGGGLATNVRKQNWKIVWMTVTCSLFGRIGLRNVVSAMVCGMS